MAEARPSKVGATWASNGSGSIRIGVRPPAASASARVAPGHAGAGDDDIGVAGSWAGL